MYKRFFAFCYDLFLLFCLWLILSMILVIALQGNPIPPHTLWYQLFLFAVAHIFFVGFWCYGHGQTVGLKAWGLRLAVDSVTPLSGDGRMPPIPLKQGFLYFWMGVLSFSLGGIGWLYLRGKTERSWAERVCRLKVGV